MSTKGELPKCGLSLSYKRKHLRKRSTFTHGVLFLYVKIKKGVSMEIVNIAVDKLVPYENNPRNNTEAIQYVANSIKEFGFKVPLVIDSDNVVICGHTRLLAAKQLGLKDVPCVVADDLTDEQIKAFQLTDNKVGEIATWDLNKLQLELDFLDCNMEEFGFISAMEEPDITDFLEDHESKTKEPKTVVCPDCGHAFTVE